MTPRPSMPKVSSTVSSFLIPVLVKGANTTNSTTERGKGKNELPGIVHGHGAGARLMRDMERQDTWLRNHGQKGSQKKTTTASARKARRPRQQAGGEN